MTSLQEHMTRNSVSQNKCVVNWFPFVMLSNNWSAAFHWSYPFGIPTLKKRLLDMFGITWQVKYPY